MNVPSPSSRHILRWTSQLSEGSESVRDELELLENVYLEDMEVKREMECTILKFHVKPSTADDEDKQFVWLDLQFLLEKGYPHSKPGIATVQSRGLSDAHLRSILEDLSHLSGEKLGTPMIFDLVEHARGCLTDNNKPCGHCAVCQFTMEEDDIFVRTPCYHCFHQSCMAQYVRFFRQDQGQSNSGGGGATQANAPKKLECPVCRELLPDDEACVAGMENVSLASTTESDDSPFHFEVTREMKAWQLQMAAMLRKQYEKGGTIIPAQEVLIDDTWVSLPSTREEAPVVHHSIALSKPENRQNSNDLGQMGGGLGDGAEGQRNAKGSRESVGPGRVRCPPGFTSVQKGHEYSRRGHDDGGHGRRGHDDGGHGRRGRDDGGHGRRGHDDGGHGRRGHDDGGHGRRGHDDGGHGSRRHGYREHGCRHLDKNNLCDDAGSGRQHPTDSAQQKIGGMERHTKELKEGSSTGRRDGVGLSVIKVTRQVAVEHRDHARHDNPKRVLHHCPKDTTSRKSPEPQAKLSGTVVDTMHSSGFTTHTHT